MSEVRVDSLRMYQEFNGESPRISSEILRMLQFTGLESFVQQVEKLITEKSNPFFEQASLLFAHTIDEIANLKTEALNNIAAKRLLKSFGFAGIGINQKTGEVDDKITSSILETHGNLTDKVGTSSEELSNSTNKFEVFIATMQRGIVDLLVKSQKFSLLQLELREKEEERVEQHLDNQTSEETVVYNSIEASKKAQKGRRKEDFEEGKSITNQLSTLFAFAQKIFEPVQKGTQEMRLVPVIG